MIFGLLRKNLETEAVAVAFIMSWHEDEDGKGGGAGGALGRLAGFRRELYFSLGMRRDVLLEACDAALCKPGLSGDRYLGPIRVSDLRGPFRLAKIPQTTCQESWPARVSGASLASHSGPVNPCKAAGHGPTGARTGPTQLTKPAKGPQRLAEG